MIPPPIQSPKPKYYAPGETPTGNFRALKKQVKWGSIVAGCAMIGTIGGATLAVGVEARAQAKQEIAPIASEMALIKEDNAATKKENAEWKARVERRLERQDEKQDLVLDALRVPLWKRPEPEPKDGGR